MPAVCRLGDASSHGGHITVGQSNFLVDGIAVAVNGASHTCPIAGHGVTPVTGTGKLKVNGLNTVKVGDTAGCGATMSEGSPKTSTL